MTIAIKNKCSIGLQNISDFGSVQAEQAPRCIDWNNITKKAMPASICGAAADAAVAL